MYFLIWCYDVRSIRCSLCFIKIKMLLLPQSVPTLAWLATDISDFINDVECLAEKFSWLWNCCQFLAKQYVLNYASCWEPRFRKSNVQNVNIRFFFFFWQTFAFNILFIILPYLHCEMQVFWKIPMTSLPAFNRILFHFIFLWSTCTVSSKFIISSF